MPLLCLVILLAGCAATSQPGDVARVIDGDTVVMENGEHVRVIGVDAPERGRCGFYASRDALRRALSGRAVTLEDSARTADRDRYGRLLRYLRANRADAGREIIARGYAKAYRRFPHERMSTYLRAERGANRARRGLWRTCA